MKFRILLPLFALGLLAGCGSPVGREGQRQESSPVAVQTVVVQQTEWPSLYEATGTVRAQTAAVLSAKVMGYVREVRVQAGDRVRQGQTLVVLDSRDLEAGLRQADAARKEAHSAIPEVENAVAAARANLDLAEVTFKRMQDLFDKKSISNQEFDEASARLKAARANHEMALSKRLQLEAKVAQAEEGYKAAGVMRSYAEIAAPFPGIVTEKHTDPGSMAAPGAPLLTLEREGAYRLETAVEESRLPMIRVGQAVNVTLDALGKTLEARVSEIVPAVDASSRSYTVKIGLPAIPQLRSGLFGRAGFALGKRAAVTVPAAAIVERGQLHSVMAVDAGQARTRLVTTGERIKDQVEILSGLNVGDRIVFPVPAGLADGSRVEVRP